MKTNDIKVVVAIAIPDLLSGDGFAEIGDVSAGAVAQWKDLRADRVEHIRYERAFLE